MSDRILRAAAYTRVSMGEQVKGHSLDAQAEHIQAYVAAHGWRLVQVYTDAGISAKQGTRRPAFEQMLADAHTGLFDVVVVDKIDRFSRHLSSLLTALDQLNQANVSFVSVQEHLDLTTPWGKLMLTVLGMLAEIYIDNLRQETRKGKVQRAHKGLWNGNIPLGYCRGLCADCADPNGKDYCPNFGQSNLSDGTQLVAHPIESLAVRLAFEWYITQRLSDGRIAEKLNTYLCPLPDGSIIHFRTKGVPNLFPPGPFTKDAVRDLLQRRLYCGQLVYRGSDEHGQRKRRNNIAETLPSPHPILVDPATFDLAQEIRQALTCAPRIKHGRPTEIYPLAGILRCAECGRPMRAASTRGQRYYRDATRIEHRDQCNQPTLIADDIETQVADVLAHIHLPQDWPINAAQWLGLEDNAPHTQQAEQRWQRARELYLTGAMNRAEFEEEKRRYELQKRDLTNEKLGAIIKVGELVRDFLWAEALPIEKRKLLRSSFAAVIVRGNTLVAVQPTPALLPLVLRAQRFPEGNSCNCGDDGIRTRDLCLDRAAC